MLNATLEKRVFPQFQLENKDEILEFIDRHPGLAEVIEKSIPILKRHFPEYTYRLKYEQDPECDELSLVRIHVNSDRSKFDEDFETTLDVNRAIRHLDVEDDDEKFYLAADLWRL